MVDLALLVHVLPRPYHHGLGRRDVYDRRFSGVSVRYPYRERESVRAAAKVDGQRAGEVHQQRAGAVGGSWPVRFCARVAGNKKKIHVLYTSVRGERVG